MKHLANILTVSRILLSVVLFFPAPLSASFFVIYLLCGLTDMIDGPIARKSGTDCAFGARLDSVADLIFLLVCLIRLLPVIVLLPLIWIWTALILLIRLVSFTAAYISRQKPLLLHTPANKMTGLLLFLLPMSFHFVNVNYAAIPVCTAATWAAAEEFIFIIKRKNG
ncbi:MAG: CDP-alcohol phosphatidyltransferase family protein [Clostridiales bacterium]|nr:CDP-alcohol phosphatidyltransferase family protein [Candidatus Cacconaster stercorequi]